MFVCLLFNFAVNCICYEGPVILTYNPLTSKWHNYSILAVRNSASYLNFLYCSVSLRHVADTEGIIPLSLKIVMGACGISALW